MTTPQSEQLAQYLLETLQRAENFTLTQAPEIAREVVVFGRFLEGLGVLLGLILTLTALWCARRWFKIKEKEGTDFDPLEHAFGYVLVGSIISIFGIMILALALPDFIKACFLPRLYILDYLRTVA